jgi:small subunit ribosomal protein S20
VANIKSQIKRNKQNAARHERNKAVRSELKTRVKRAVVAAETGADDAAAAAVIAQKRLDKAAAKRIIHPNAAARRQSRLARRLNAAKAVAAPSAET